MKAFYLSFSIHLFLLVLFTRKSFFQSSCSIFSVYLSDFLSSRCSASLILSISLSSFFYHALRSHSHYLFGLWENHFLGFCRSFEEVFYFQVIFENLLPLTLHTPLSACFVYKKIIFHPLASWFQENHFLGFSEVVERVFTYT